MVLLTKKTNINIKKRTKTGDNMNFILKTTLFLILLGSKLIACAGTWHELYLKDEHYNFLDPIMIDLDKSNPLYNLSGSYAAHDARFEYFKEAKKKSNIEAWKKYFKNSLSYEEVENLFYKPNAIEYTAQEYKSGTNNPNFSQYIQFLHLQNKLAQNTKESKNYNEVVAKGLKLLQEEQDPFLTERYLYLLMRLYHHHAEYNIMLDIYANYSHIINPSSPVSEWIDALRAGAYQNLKNNFKANQLYAQIFKNNKTNAHYGFYDFKVSNNEEWEKLLKSSKDNNEKALYHFLRAMQWRNEPMYELQAIAEIAPKSIWFERLSYMIMQDLQNQRYNIMVHSGKKNDYFKARVKTYKLQKNHFLSVLKELKEQSFFTLYSKLYLNLLEYNSIQRKDLIELRSLANLKQKPYAKLLSYMYGVHQLSSNSLEEQHNLYIQLQPLLSKLSKKQQISILRYTALQISTLEEENTIEQKMNKLFAENANSRLAILQAINFDDAQKYEYYIEKEKRSFFEAEVFKATMRSLKRGDIAKTLATLYLQDNNFNKAKFYLRQTPEHNVFTPYNPFNVSINGSNRTKSKKTYTQRKFIETMLRLQSVLRKNPKSARDHFLYANGLYNKSWFGNFPMSSVLHRSISLYKGEPLPETTNLTEAETEYLLALKYAKTEEFKAKISYQLLKIEFNRAISNTYSYDNEMWDMPYFGSWINGTDKVIKILDASKDFTEAIKDFRAEYGKTTYGEEVIKNCITFQYF